MDSLCERDEPQGIVATFPLAPPSLDALKLIGRELVVVLDRLQDPGNLGTLIRTADAVGAAALILIEPCVDPFDPKTVRGSMGSLFNLPIVSTKDVGGLFAWLKTAGLRPVGADPHLGEIWGKGCGLAASRSSWGMRRAASPPTSRPKSARGRSCRSSARPNR